MMQRLANDGRIHILHVVGRLDIGGAESRIMDLYRNIDREQIQFDFMQHTSDICAYQNEVESMGGHVYHVPRFRIYNILQYRKSWKQFMQAHPEIQIVHGHMTSVAGLYLPIAKKYGNAYTIAHARSAGVDKGIKGFVTNIFRRNLSEKCNQCFTCSDLAGVAVFGERAVQEGKVKMIPNAISVGRFEYQEQKRNELREALGIEKDAYVIGHVGRFNAVKNHAYMLDIFECCYRRDSKCRMMFVGDGGLKEEMMKKAKDKGLEKYIIFTGNQKNVVDYYQAMDFFILPSFYEGLPGTAIEAQATGLRGILSDRVTKEALVTDLMKQMSIDLPADEWAKEILAKIVYQRTSHVEQVREAGYDVEEQAERLSEFYLGVCNNENRD